MLFVLLAKDLRRAWRNPLPWLINLIVPLVMTALIGLVFGGNSEGGALGRIRFAVVNEDQPLLTTILRGAANQENADKYLDTVFMTRSNALREVNAGNLSAVVIIPTNFVMDYLTARAPVSIELVKNPAESIHPAVLEESLGVVVAAMNVAARNFNSEFPEWKEVFSGQTNYHQVSSLIERTGNQLKDARKFIDPPLVGYQKEDTGAKTNTGATASDGTTPEASADGSKSSVDNLFAFLLIGLSAMFLLFIAGNAVNDLQRELRMRTFARYQTLHDSLWPFIASKMVFAIVLLMLGGAVMLGGGALIFRFHWEHPLLLVPLGLGYACFIAALYTVLAALVPDERRANVFNSITSMMLGLVGGCAFPPRQLPAFLRDHISPLLPSYWFAATARNLECGDGHASWLMVSLKLAVLAVVLAGLAALLFRRRFKTGLRA